ncbi:MAG: hypothetical protein HQ530_05520 [Parcubacteria group bacterium]|nr:hypothetical protein [Parcubacteria group bacterium]
MKDINELNKELSIAKKIDGEYRQLLKKSINKTKKSLPHYAKIHNYRIMEDNDIFNGRMISTGLKPRFITRAQENHLKTRSQLYIKLLGRLGEILNSSPAAQNYFGITKAEKEYLKNQTTTHHLPTVRCDGCLDKEKGFRIFEANTNAPAVAGFTQHAWQLLDEFPAWQAIKQKYRVTPNSLHPQKILNVLLENYQAWGGKKSRPSILILRWEGQYNQDSDFLAQEFQKLGYQTTVGYPTQLFYNGRDLYYQGTKYELVLRWFDLNLITETAPIYQDLLRAYFDNKICLVSPPASAAYAHKSFFAFFTDKQFSQYLTDHERKTLGQMCPWTRPLRPMKTEFQPGKKEDLYDIAVKYKNKLLLKKSISTHGKDIIFGQKTSLPEWKKILNKVKKDRWLVQEMIDLPRDYEPYLTKKGLVQKEFYHDINPYLINGKYLGCVARFSPNLITNAIKGGTLQVVGRVK